MRGELDQQALHLSLRAIINRHEALRTVFSLEGGEPVQKVIAFEEVPLEMADLSDNKGEQNRELEARWLAEQEAAWVFDISRGPLFRLKLLRLSDQDHVLLVVMHHLVSDGWSVGILVQEFVELYSSHRQGREP